MHAALVIALATGSACSTYASRVATWNFLMPTPAFAPEVEHVPVEELISQPLAWTALGHATTIVSLGQALVVTDPIVHARMNVPSAPFGLGPRRITKLPAIDLRALPVTTIVVSHDHPDHYDPDSILSFRLQGVDLVLPPGISSVDRDRFRAAGARVTTLSWTEAQSPASTLSSTGVTIRAFQVKHWGTECSPHSQCANGYVFEATSGRVAFFGDTAWRPSPPIEPRGYDLCIVPIGAAYYRANHMRPYEAWQLHREIGCRVTTPIHWRTFVDEPRPGFFASDADWRRWMDEPLCGLLAAAEGDDLASEVRCIDTGAVCTSGTPGPDPAFVARCHELSGKPRERAWDAFVP